MADTYDDAGKPKGIVRAKGWVERCDIYGVRYPKDKSAEEMCYVEEIPSVAVRGVTDVKAINWRTWIEVPADLYGKNVTYIIVPEQ